MRPPALKKRLSLRSFFGGFLFIVIVIPLPCIEDQQQNYSIFVIDKSVCMYAPEGVDDE